MMFLQNTTFHTKNHSCLKIWNVQCVALKFNRSKLMYAKYRLNASLNGCTSRTLCRSTLQSCCKYKYNGATLFMQINKITTGMYHSLKTQKQGTLAIILTYLLRHKQYMQLRHNSKTNNYYTFLTTLSIERLNVRT